ncbi:MAG: aminopeptidase P family N-terminal domain-containing protein, partial [Muribaculaceae bacterium]|nr:aminopeptidase P family N-terminal domain-containing protein [Muribaculaceae bacterium]
MAGRNISAAIIPQTDPHQSEYIAEHWQLIRFISGFTGSAGTLVITADSAFLWTDSRYFIQAAAQLADTGIGLMKDGLPSTPSIMEYLVENLKEGDNVGIDGFMFPLSKVDEMRAQLAVHGIGLDISFDVVDNIWPDRPTLPMDRIFVHDEKFAGESARSKIEIVRADMHRQGADAALIVPLDEIAWTLNIRCN